MTEWRDRFEDSPGTARFFEFAERYYHWVAVAALSLVIVWLRVRHWGRFIVDGEVLFNGNDPWYHYRQIVYTVDHWPQTMPFEVFTNFPEGTASGQFGTLFDQIIATIALVVGLGNPSDHLVAMVALFAPVLFALAVVAPTYLIGRRMGGRAGAVAALIVITFTTAGYLQRSWVGTVDHHIAEMLFQVLAVLGIMVALSVANREKPIFEQLAERDLDALRQTVGWSALAGVGVALYLWVWPFGVLLLGTLGVFFLVQLSAEFMRGESPEHTAIAGAIAMSVTGVLVLAKFQTVEITASDFSLLQPILAFGLAAWCLGMAWLARVWERRDVATWQYPVAVVGVLVVGALAMRLLAPGLWNYFTGNVIRILGLGFGVSREALSVGEITPLAGPAEFFRMFRFAIFAALGAVIWLGGRLLAGREVRSEYVLVVVWALFMTAATFTQERFSYYLVVPVAALTAHTVGLLVEGLDLHFDPDILQFFKLVGVASIAIILVVPMVAMTPTAMEVSQINSPGGGIQGWTDSLEWVESHTPAEGQFDDGSTTMDYGGTYAATDDYDYPNGAYGILSWWDYGHWITVQSHRIPVANPFQQHASDAANFLLAPNETQADDVLAGLSEDDAETRYVMVDWKMVHTNGNLNPFTPNPEVNGKFFAPTRFYDVSNVSEGEYFRSLYTTRFGGRLRQISYRTQNYYDSMVVRLYRYHGSSMEPRPVVLDWNVQSYQGTQLPMVPPSDSGSALRFFPNMSSAEAYTEQDQTSQVGGVGPYPQERVPALEHYRLVGSSEMQASSSGSYRYSQLLNAAGLGLNASVNQQGQPCDTDISIALNGGRSFCLHESARDFLLSQPQQWTKVFERVEGATIEGTGPANANVTATVEMRNPANGETFNYTQRVQTGADGSFTMTVPYSTTGYDEYGPENGHTNVSVRATGPYVLTATDDGTTYRAETQVSEAAVLGDTGGPIEVDLEATDGGAGSLGGPAVDATTATDETAAQP